MSETDEQPYRAMVSEQNDQQVDTWAADLFIDFAKRRGVGTAIAAFCAAAKLDARASSGPSSSAAGPTTWSGSTRTASWRHRSSSCRKPSPGFGRSTLRARERLVDFLVGQREVMSYTP